eukprot:TRINITY_DN83464_c0_g1_i1.p1 TRINITY_DN83464_c0_g1~~TRINITY_DN83464_c0_g1_i1.p1  ORF type:complete len:282 (-),score=69.12 TRINITY_DN83464_c0_g1_i1:3-848(-)
MKFHVRPLVRADRKQAVTLFRECAYNLRDVPGVLTSIAGMAGMLGAALALDGQLVTEDLKVNGGTLQVVGLHMLSVLLGGGSVALFLLFYASVVAQKFVNDAVDDFQESADTYYSAECHDHPGLGTASHIFVAEELSSEGGEASASKLVGIIVLKASSVKWNRRWLADRKMAKSAPNYDWNNALAHVDWLLVPKGAQRKGVGSALLKAAEEQVRPLIDEDRKRLVYLHLRCTVRSECKKATLFYEQRGFSEEGSLSDLFAAKTMYLCKKLQEEPKQTESGE